MEEDVQRYNEPIDETETHAMERLITAALFICFILTAVKGYNRMVVFKTKQKTKVACKHIAILIGVCICIQKHI
jgi:hypothetical protein